LPDKFKLESETYGTPFYLSLEELKLIYQTNFNDNPILNIQKDVFVFQCCVGCRVGDLMKLKKTDIIKLTYKDKHYIYEIKDIWEIEKTGSINIEKENNTQLILTTCSPTKENYQLIINSIQIKKES
jgi:hypothetical protein